MATKYMCQRRDGEVYEAVLPKLIATIQREYSCTVDEATKLLARADEENPLVISKEEMAWCE